MAGREVGEVRFGFTGDTKAAQAYGGIARTQLGILKNLMSFNNLQQLSRSIKLSDGTTIFVSSIFGQDTIRVDVPVIEEAAPATPVKVVSAVNKVADYVAVAMPNPVPYRGMSIGVVDKGVPSIAVTDSTPQYITTRSWVAKHSDGSEAGNGQGTNDQTGYYTHGTQSAGSVVVFFTYTAYYFDQAGAASFANAWNQYGFGITVPAGAWLQLNGTISYTTNGFSWSPSGSTLVFSVLNPTYESLLTADQAAETGGIRTYIMTSDGTVLASEVQNTSGGHTYYVPDTTWNGEGYCNMYVDDPTIPPVNHQLAFTVPEDCIYPMPNVNSTIFNTRRKAWFKKNSDEFIAALKGKFQPGATGVTRAELQMGALPASWDYAIKTHVRTSFKTYQPILLNANYIDTVMSDTSANLTQAGTKATKRSVTFQYIDAQGANQTATIDGTLTQVVSDNTIGFSWVSTYARWYEETPPDTGVRTVGASKKIQQQFLRDRATSSLSLGLLWNGTAQGGDQIEKFADSTWGIPTDPMVYAGTENPPYPYYSNTLVGTAPQFFLDYHGYVQPKYHSDTPSTTHDGNTAWNNSALYNVKQVDLLLFGPVQADGTVLGIFPDPTDADGCTQIAYYGEASFTFDWLTGSLTWKGWAARKDANDNDAPTIIDMPAGYSYHNNNGTLQFKHGTTVITAYNCAIGYIWDAPEQMWPDVAEYLRAKIATMVSGGGDQVLYTIIKQALALV